ncbi:MAG TPA: CcdB family protein [Caulobacteraceae bacterium]
MRQYDVYRNPASPSARFAPYLIVLQSHYVVLDTVLVAPLVVDKVASSIEIGIDIGGTHLVMALTEMGSVRSASLTAKITNLLEREYDIQRALDRLFRGF